MKAQASSIILFGSTSFLLAAATSAWEYVPGPDPALWSTSITPLTNPDPHASPLLHRASALLSLQCEAGHQLVFLNHNFEVEAKSAIVATSVDGGPEVTEIWRADTAISLLPPNAALFVERLKEHRVLHITVTWPGAAPTSTHFDVAGVERALVPLRTTCGW